MINHKNNKKKLIISYKNLPDSIKELFKQTYPEGYRDYLQKTIKPNGEPIFVVPLETEDTSYMVKFDVKIDTALVDDDLDKDVYNTAPLSEAVDKEEGNTSVGTLKHGSYDDMFEGLPEDKKEFEMANEDIEDSFGDLADEEEEDEDELKDMDREPDDNELLDIEALLNEADSGTGLLIEEETPIEEPASSGKRKAARADKPVAEKKKPARTKNTAKQAGDDDKKKETDAEKTTDKPTTSKRTSTAKTAAVKAKAESPKAKAATSKTATAKSTAKTAAVKAKDESPRVKAATSKTATAKSTAKTATLKTKAELPKAKAATSKTATNGTKPTSKKAKAKEPKA